MLILHGFSCEANILRGQIKHSWLENEILYISIETVITLWRQSGTDLTVKYATRLQDLSLLAENLAESFSPAQLVDKLKPFSGLTAEEKIAIKVAIHAAYLESSGILALQAPLKAAAVDLEAALQKLSRVWILPQSQGEDAVRAAWAGVRETACALIEVLELLPRGIVLP
jgi:hypothetical protein